MHRVKFVTVGDGGVGKSCLLITYTKNTFPALYVPTVFDNYVHDLTIDGKQIEVALWDTAGQEDYDRLRPLAYPQADVFMICFSVENRDSLENIRHKWYPEVSYHEPYVPIVVVACKIDLRRGLHDKTTVSFEEGAAVAKTIGARYAETSALTHTGLKACFDEALRECLARGPVKRIKFVYGRAKKDVPLPPVMPPAGFAPWIEIETAKFADDWYRVLEDPKFADVTFYLADDHQLDAHKLMLCSASRFFAKILGQSFSRRKNQLAKIQDSENWTREDLNSGCVEGISSVTETSSRPGHVSVHLSADITAATFLHVLEFLYTGVPRLADDIPEEDLLELTRVAKIFKLPQLETICRNVTNDEEFLNPSIGTFLNDETAAKMKELYFNQQNGADVIFDVQGNEVYAHKVVLMSRCDVMAAMFGGNFSEALKIGVCKAKIQSTSHECFLAFLEYLYTDHAPIESVDAMELLVLADEYCQQRLVNLCELYITKEVDRSCTKNIEKSDIDVISLLLTCQLHNADQLSNWCLHFISTNYTAFSKRSKFKMLQGPNKEHVEEHRWPPVSYLQELEEYEKLVAKQCGSCCLVM